MSVRTPWLDLLMFVRFFVRHKMDLLGESTATKIATDGDFREIIRNTKACGSMTWNHRRLDLAEREGISSVDPDAFCRLQQVQYV